MLGKDGAGWEKNLVKKMGDSWIMFGMFQFLIKQKIYFMEISNILKSNNQTKTGFFKNIR